MTEIDYKNKIKVIVEQYNQSKQQLNIEYAASQRKFKIGDVIKNKITCTIIEVQKFGCHGYFSLPKPTYIGRALRKDLQPRKDGAIETIFGNENVELIREIKH